MTREARISRACHLTVVGWGLPVVAKALGVKEKTVERWLREAGNG